MKNYRNNIKLYILFQIQNIKSLAQYRTDFLMMIFFTLYTGFTSIGINNAAHISGLAIGYLCGMCFYRRGAAIGPWLKRRLRRNF